MRASRSTDPRRRAPIAVAALLALACLASPAGSAGAAPHVPCSSAGSAHRPCYFSTPSGNIHCRWTPASQAVECVLASSRRGYRLRPTGRARAISATLPRRGERLPAGNVSIVFPKALSCTATRATMTCNQDFLTGFFKLAPHGSRSG